MQPHSITRSLWRLGAALGLVIIVVGPAGVAQDRAQPSTGTGDISGAVWREMPSYRALFSPRLHRDAYRTYVAAEPLADVLRQLSSDTAILRPPGSWSPKWLGPLDAFGDSGSYDRSKLARLFGSRRVQVARGPRTRADGGLDAWTLVSPHPDPAFGRIEAGTLLIVLRLP